MGRPSNFTPETAAVICQRLADGESLRSACLDEAMPDKATVFRWLANDEAFRDQYAHAREAQVDHYADEILCIADDSSQDTVERTRPDGSTFEAIDHDHIARSKLRVDTRKWLMSKLAPKKYGDRLQHSGDAEQPIAVAITEIRRIIVDCPDQDRKGVPPAS